MKRASLSMNSAGQQRGSIIVLAALALSAAVIMLSIADIGFMYFYKREYQKAADLGAMAGAERLSVSCNDAIEAARENVARNIGGLLHDAPVVSTGTWKRSTQPRFQASCDEETNGVRVTVLGNPPAFLLRVLGSENQRKLRAESVATNGDPVATFSVGSRLAALGGPSVIGGVLRGVGIDPALDLMSYNGLAGVMITPAGLLEALGIPVSADLNVADFNALLAAEEVTLGELLNAAATLAGQDQLLALNAQLLQALRIPLNVPSVNDIVVQLGSDSATSGLFAAITSPADAALNIGLDALGLVSTAIQVATSGRAIDVALNSLGGLGALAGADLSVKVGVIEPPSIGIGGVGATAYSAQTRVFAHVKLGTSQIPLVGNLLGGLLGTAIDVDLPLIIDLAAAKGTVEELCTTSLRDENAPPQCPGGEDCADIGVDAQIAKICVGRLDPSTMFSTAESCDVGLTSQQLLRVSVLGSNLASLNTKLDVPVLATDGSVVLAAEQKDTVNGQVNLGTTVSNLTSALLAGLLGESLGAPVPMTAAQRRSVAERLWNEAGGNSCGGGSAGRQCRRNAVAAAEQAIESAANGLNGFLATAVLNPVVGLLDSVLTLNLIGVLNSVGGLVSGVLGLVGNILGGVVQGLLGTPCTGGGLLGLLNYGSNSGCIDTLADSLGTPSGSSTSNAVVVLLGNVLNLLKPILDAVGNNLLMPLLQNLLGLQVGQTDVTLMGLECRAGAVLVE